MLLRVKTKLKNKINTAKTPETEKCKGSWNIWSWQVYCKCFEQDKYKWLGEWFGEDIYQSEMITFDVIQLFKVFIIPREECRVLCRKEGWNTSFDYTCCKKIMICL